MERFQLSVAETVPLVTLCPRTALAFSGALTVRLRSAAADVELAPNDEPLAHPVQDVDTLRLADNRATPDAALKDGGKRTRVAAQPPGPETLDTFSVAQTPGYGGF